MSETTARRKNGRGREASLRRIPRKNLSDRLAEEVRDAILSLHFPAGAQLNEQDLAEEFGVSRGPVREALQRLIQEGLLVSEPHRGVFVKELTDSDLIDVYLARETLEAAAVRQVMRSHRLDALCHVLAGIVKQMEKAGSRSDWQRMMELDFEFHRELVAAADSPRLSRMYETVQAEARLCLHLLIGGYRGSAALVDEHQTLLDSLRSGDAEATVVELRRHFGDPVSLLERARSQREKQRASDAA